MQISDAGAIAIADMLRYNTSLEYLNLESNVVADRACEAFIRYKAIHWSVLWCIVTYHVSWDVIMIRIVWRGAR